MENILTLIRRRRVYADGGAGSLLLKSGLPAGTPPEAWNLTNPEKIIAMHRAYLDAGADILTLNCFGANPLRRDTFREEIAGAVACARHAAEGRDVYLALDMGPCGRMLAPFGDLSMEDAIAAFREVAAFGASLGVDLILIETMSDLCEAKAALLGAKEGCDLPVFVTCAFGGDGKLMTGADPLAVIATLEGCGADVIGMNCSLGPDKMIPLMADFKKYASVPVLVSPNAGLPRVENGVTLYDTDADAFSDAAAELARAGADLLGGCCGTEPEYIRKTIEKTKNIPLSCSGEKNYTFISSNTHALVLGDMPLLIGERLNPTGKPKIKAALREKNLDLLCEEGISQADAGAQALDVNVGLPDIDEAEMLPAVMCALQAVCDVPLQLDTADPIAMEKALRRCMGRPLINSVNGKESSMAAILPLAKKYGGVLIALTLDENGIPATAEGRVEIAERIIARAAEYGIAKKNIIADPLALAVSSDGESAKVTLEALRLLHQKGIYTSLGVSNISFGLPRREELNTAFFTLSINAGLTCAIMNPFCRPMMSAWYSFGVLAGKDPACSRYIGFGEGGVSAPEAAKKSASLYDLILQGRSAGAVAAAEKELTARAPLDVLNGSVLPALSEVGDRFAKGKAFLPQLLMSAEAAVAALVPIKNALPAAEGSDRRRVILATVEGDVHDIGKNIVKTLLESHGFAVTDLGKDVPPEKVLAAVENTGCRLVGLSALMTTTVPSMEKTIALLHEKYPDCKVIVGGAVLTESYAKTIGADYYSAEAPETVRIAGEYYK